MGDHRVIEIGNVRPAYRIWGPSDAPPLVLPHALGEDAGHLIHQAAPEAFTNTVLTLLRSPDHGRG